MKKGIVNALTLVLCLVNVVLMVILTFTLVPAVKQNTTLVNAAIERLNLDIGSDTDNTADSQISLADLTSTAVTFGEDSDTTVLMAASKDGKSHYVKLGVSLNLNTKDEDYTTLSTSITTNMSVIDSTIIDVVSEYSYDDYDSEMKTEMQNAVLKKLQEAYGSTCIYSVTFSPFTVQ